MAEREGVSVVLPVLNERDNLEPLHARLTEALKPLGRDYEIIYVDDGSADGSWDVLRALAAGDSHVRLVRLRKNFGQTPALSAGLAHSRYPILVTLDADCRTILATSRGCSRRSAIRTTWSRDGGAAGTISGSRGACHRTRRTS